MDDYQQSQWTSRSSKPRPDAKRSHNAPQRKGTAAQAGLVSYGSLVGSVERNPSTQEYNTIFTLSARSCAVALLVEKVGCAAAGRAVA